MTRLGYAFGTRQKPFLGAALFAGLAVPILLSVGVAAQLPAQNTAQSARQALAAKISAFADAQCRLEALWAATQCDPDVLKRQSQEVGGSVCIVPKGEFAFDVVSIKPHKNDVVGRRPAATVGVTLDGYRSLNAPVSYLILNAYNIGLQTDITGGPSWLKEDRYDFEGKYTPEVAAAILKLSRDDYGFVFRHLLQQVLSDRMTFSAHMETKDVPAYNLVIGKNGAKLKDADLTAPDVGDTVIRADPGKPGMLLMISKGVRMSYLVSLISQPSGRPVIDKTGLTGLYDVTLEYARQQASTAAAPGGGATGDGPVPLLDPIGPSVFDAVQLLGLKLVPSRGPIMVIAIDHIERPSEN
jgi:uncharacterized protein (TIGR03435 family)